MRRSCFPSSSSHQHGPPLLGRVRHATPFPDVNARMQPSDSLVPFGRRSGLPSPTTYLGAQALFFAATPVPTPTCATSETLLPRLPVRRLSLPKEKRGYPRCLGHPLRACRGPRPRRVQPPLARSRCGHRRLQVWKYLGHPEVSSFRGCSTHGPHCCFSHFLVEPPRELAGLFRRRIGWDDGAIRDPAGAVAFLMNRRCRSGEDVGTRASSVGKRWGSASFSRACPHAP